MSESHPAFDMSARLKRNALCLCLLAKAEPALARAIIEKGNANMVRSLCDCAHNILKGNVPLKKSQKGRFRRYKKDLRALVQSGGGGLLAPLPTSLLAPLVY